MAPSTTITLSSRSNKKLKRDGAKPTKSIKEKLDASTKKRSVSFVEKDAKGKGKEKEEVQEYLSHGMDLPKALDILGHPFDANELNEKCRVVVIGVAGWSPGVFLRLHLPTGRR